MAGNQATAKPVANMRVELAGVLGLARENVTITAIRLLGNGPSASAEMDLSTGLTIVAERFGDLWTAAGLAKFITQSTGIRPQGLTKTQAEQANALIRRIAQVTRETRVADLGRDHGLVFLRWAPVEPFFLHDQADRYRAFSLVDACDLGRAGWNQREGRVIRPAELSRVLQDRRTAVRYVHCGHLFTDAHSRNEVSHPRELADQMVKAGWERSGKRGRIKATSVGLGSPIVLPMWVVPRGWDDSAEDEPEGVNDDES